MSTKVLVIDDQPDNVDLLCQMLEDHDYIALSADNGVEGLAIAVAEQPDVIILDIQMPGMDGYEVCQYLKDNERTRNIPVIFLTAIYSSEKNIVKGLELGAYDYVTKPFREMELIARIRVMAKIKKTEEDVREDSITDALTGLYNRRFLEKRFSEEVSRAQRVQLPLSCLMVDIDHFKSINDLHGHDVGDMVLRDAAQVIKKSLRQYDTVARYGGEEFIVILPSTDYDDGFCVAEKIRKAIESYGFHKGTTALSVTISLGLYCGNGAALNESYEIFIKHADEALYKAKGSGRNKAVMYRDVVPGQE